MSVLRWVGSLAGIAVWFCAFASLAIGRQWIERWFIAFFQRRRQRATTFVTWPLGQKCKRSPGNTVACVLAAITATLAGAAIPLAPQIQIGEQALSFHVFGNTSAGLLYVLALEWLSAGMLIWAERDTGSPRHHVALVGESLLGILPTSCVLLNLILTAGTLHARQQGSLNLVTLVALQGEWGGLRWLGIFQPLSLLLWLVCSAPLRSLVQTRATFARQVHALNRTLLASTLFLGGWQGPFVGSRFWLGLAYTTVKVGWITFLWVWTWSSLPQPGVSTSTRTVWHVLVPLAVLNLLLTAAVVVLL